MLFVVCLLQRPSSRRLLNGCLHGAGDGVTIQNDASIDISSGPTNGLHQRCLVAQKPFFVCVQHRNQRHLWQIQPLSQQVDANQDIKHTQPQISQDLHALQRVDITVQVSAF